MDPLSCSQSVVHSCVNRLPMPSYPIACRFRTRTRTECKQFQWKDKGEGRGGGGQIADCCDLERWVGTNFHRNKRSRTTSVNY